METTEAESVAENEFLTFVFSFSSCELILDAVMRSPLYESGVSCIGGSCWLLDGALFSSLRCPPELRQIARLSVPLKIGYQRDTLQLTTTPRILEVYSTELKTQHLIYPTVHSSWHM